MLVQRERSLGYFDCFLNILRNQVRGLNLVPGVMVRKHPVNHGDVWNGVVWVGSLQRLARIVVGLDE